MLCILNLCFSRLTAPSLTCRWSQHGIKLPWCKCGFVVTLIKVGWSLSVTTKPIILRKRLFPPSLYLFSTSTVLSDWLWIKCFLLQNHRVMNESLFNVTGKVVRSHSRLCIWQGEVCYMCGSGGGSQPVLLRKILGILTSTLSIFNQV